MDIAGTRVFDAELVPRVTAVSPRVGSLAGGTDDMEKAYRKMPVDDPSLTVICQWDPFNSRPVFFQVQGFPFGLATAVNGFNRLTAFLTAFHRRILRAPCSNYYDDFVVWSTGSSRLW